MEYITEDLEKAEIMEKRVQAVCQYNGAKYKVQNGFVYHINKTNLKFVLPHKILIRVKDCGLVVVYYNNEQLFLYDKCNPITIKELKDIINGIRKGELEVCQIRK